MTSRYTPGRVYPPERQRDEAIRPRTRATNHLAMDTTIKHFIRTLEDARIMQSCIVCLHFNEESEICSKFQARPPARVIAYSCPDFSDADDVPF